MVNILSRGVVIGAVSVFAGAAWCGGADVAMASSVARPVAISPDSGHLLVTNGNGQELHLMNTLSGKVHKVSGGSTAGYGASISANSSLVAFKSINAENGLQSPALYDSAADKTTLLATSALAGTPAISDSGRIAYTVENELSVQAADGSIVATFDLGHHVNLLAISGDGNRIAYNDEADQIIIIDVKTGKRKKATDNKASYFGPIFSPNGKNLLVQTVTGDVAVVKKNRSKVKILGIGSNPSWLDDSTIAYTDKTVIDGVSVTRSDLIAVKISGKSKGVLATTAGDAVATANGVAVAFSATAAPGASARVASNALQVGLASDGQAWTESVSVQLDEASDASKASSLKVAVVQPETVQANSVVDTGSTVYLSNVPYIHQNNDTPDWWNGNSSCNAAAALMGIQYYNILPKHPMTSSWPTPHNSDYGWYIPNQYTFNGNTYSATSQDPNGTTGRGGFGYITRNNWVDTKGYMRDFINQHGPSSAVDWSPTIAKARTDIDNNYPFVILTSITSAGHYPLCIGYVKNQHTLIFNDPYGNKNTGSYPSNDGRMARYDWPGYNNGYSNMNTVHCYIWCRQTQNVPPPTIIVDNTDSGFSASSSWSSGTSASDKYGSNYRFRSTQAVSDAATWNFTITQAGSYRVDAWWTAGSNRAAAASYVMPNGGSVQKNQQGGGGAWQTLGTQTLSTGAKNVKLSCWTTAGFVVVADAVRIVPLF